MPRLGDRIGESYVITGVLGEGGMGVVFRAHDDRLLRDVAIKMVRPRWVERAHLLDRFASEARALARVRHPNVLDVYAFGVHVDLPYFVTEHVPGRTLDDVAWEGGLGATRALDVVERLCRGLDAVHRAGLVHGDVKPSNVMLADGGRVALMDLGLARLLDGNEVRVPGLWGTPAYIAPELATGRPVPPAMLPLADVYSAAVVAYELLCGRPPFVTKDIDEMLGLHASAPVPPPRELAPDIPPRLENALLRALDKDPVRRPQSAGELGRTLRVAAETARRIPRRLRVLVVDDDADHRALVSRLLARAFPGAVVETCSDGAGALAVVRRRLPHLAIVDLDMPGMNGVELTATLKSDPRTDAMPIIVLSGRGSADDWRLLSRLGADRFAVKPLFGDAFVATVRGLLEVPGEEDTEED